MGVPLNQLLGAKSDAELTALYEQALLVQLREQATTSLSAFFRYVFREMLEATHGTWHTLPRHIEDEWIPLLEDETILKLAIEAPVEHVKSVLLRCFILWTIGRERNTRAALLQRETEGQAWASARVVKTILNGDGLEGERYREVFPEIEPDPDQPWRQGEIYVKRTSIQKDATLYASGIFGTYQGSRWDIAVLDDVVNQNDAKSAATMASIEALIRGTIASRMVAGGRMIAVYTRWGKGDLHVVLSSMGFRIVTMPAIGYWDRTTDDKGKVTYGNEALWPEYWPLKGQMRGHAGHSLEDKRLEMGTAMFQVSMLCDPSASDGGRIDRSWWKIIDQKPGGVCIHDKTEMHEWVYGLCNGPFNRPVFRWIRRWDLAATKKQPGNEPDWTRGLLVGINTATNELVVADMRSAREEPPGPQKLLVATAKEIDGRLVPVRWEQEPGSSGKMAADAIGRELMGWDARAVTSTGEKIARCNPLITAVEAGRVSLVRGAWNEALLDEGAAFPFGKHDDAIDALSQALGDLTQGGPAIESQDPWV